MTKSALSYRQPQRPGAAHLGESGIFASGGGAFWSVAAIIIFAVAFGGGGSKYGLANLVVQIASLVALSFHRRAFFGLWKSAPAAMTVLIGLSFLLPVLYLIPLPQTVWTALPGRELVSQSFDLIGKDGWAPASVDPLRTLLALTALIVPLAFLSIGWTVQPRQLIIIGWGVVAAGLLNFLMGIPQVLSGTGAGLLYPEISMPGVLFGTFANRNSAGLFLVGALTLASLLPPPPRIGRGAFGVRIAVCALLIVAIILTRSRTALILTLIPVCIAVARSIFALLANRQAGAMTTNRNRVFALIPVAVILAVLAGIFFAAPGRVGDAIERFEQTDDARAYIWEDAIYSADRYWPAGSGVGTFEDVFQIDESLENMTLRRAGRAHNDYLEVAIETGLPGLVLIAGWLLLIVWLCWRARGSHDRWIAWSGGIILLTIALQSITDYPLRNMTMLTLGSFALLILARFGVPMSPDSNREVLP